MATLASAAFRSTRVATRYSTFARCLLSTRVHEQLNGHAYSQTTPSPSTKEQETVEGPLQIGSRLDHAIDLRYSRPGDRLEIPYELTISDTLPDFWSAAFFDQSRISTSRPFCRSMGLQDRALPFSLALFMTSSMSHADAAKVQVGFGRVDYVWPLFAGDTVRRSFEVRSVRNTSDGNHSVIEFTCDLVNQRGRLCMRADKQMLFQFPVVESAKKPPSHDDLDRYVLRDHIVNKATSVLAHSPSQSLSRLQPGDLILHSLQRCLTFAQSQQLASLVRLTHPRHFDLRRYERSSEILIPGGLVLGLTMSASARDLHEILHEQIVSASYANPLHPENMVGSVSYVTSIDENLPGDLELVSVVTLGLKNVDVGRDLEGVGLPLALFQPGLHAKEIEQICKRSCPILSGKVVVAVERRILRQARHKEVFLL